MGKSRGRESGMGKSRGREASQKGPGIEEEIQRSHVPFQGRKETMERDTFSVRACSSEESLQRL